MINNINENDFRGVDLNLMVTLMVLLRERSVSRAAERLHLGQPAVSGALARLRGLFDDELLVRTGGAMLPTPRALELERSMGQALYDMHLALFQPPSFDPLTVARTVTIGMPDWIDTWLLPPLLAALSRKAPHVRVRVLETDPYTVSDMLAKEEIELAIGAFDQGPPWKRRAGLASMAFRCVGRPDVIGRGGKMTLAEYTGLSHLLVSHRGGVRGARRQGPGHARAVAQRGVYQPAFLLVAQGAATGGRGGGRAGRPGAHLGKRFRPAVRRHSARSAHHRDRPRLARHARQGRLCPVGLRHRQGSRARPCRR